jgi:hypothetical protein
MAIVHPVASPSPEGGVAAGDGVGGAVCSVGCSLCGDDGVVGAADGVGDGAGAEVPFGVDQGVSISAGLVAVGVSPGVGVSAGVGIFAGG